MSSSRPSVSDDLRGPSVSLGSGPAAAHAPQREPSDGGETYGQRASGGQGGPGSSRKKRRRARSQRGKRRQVPHGSHRPAHIDTVSRERIFQDIEGLLRQIREQAEESKTWTDEQLSQFVQAVTTFTKSLEEESDPISDRARSEYHRIRERLSQALRG